jgi:hypothetical protein
MRMVSERTLEPESFAYPTLHMITLGGAAVLPGLALRAAANVAHGRTLLDGIRPGYWQLVPEITLLSRLVSATLAAATCLAVARIGRRLFDETTGLVAAALLSVSAGLVGLAHFATVDVAATFWATLSFLATLVAFERGGRARFLVAGLALGLATSAKYTGVMLAVPLGLALLLAPPGRGSPRRAVAWRAERGALVAAGAVAGFFLGTPAALTAFPRFVGDFVQLNFYQPDYAGDVRSGYVAHLANLVNLEGPALAAAALAGLALLVARAARERDPRLVLLLSAVAAIYLKMGSMHFAPGRYALPLLPFLSLAAAPLFVEAWRRAATAGPSTRLALRAGVLVCLAATVLWVVLGTAEFFRDDRDRARAWIVAHVPPSASIEISHAYGVDLPAAYGHVAKIPFHHVKPGVRRMLESASYQRIVRRLPWLELRTYPEAERGEPPETGLPALLARDPDVIVVAEECYARFLTAEGAAAYPRQSALYRALLEGTTPYGVAIDFRSDPSLLRPRIEFVHGGITIFVREKGAAAGGAAAPAPTP